MSNLAQARVSAKSHPVPQGLQSRQKQSNTPPSSWPERACRRCSGRVVIDSYNTEEGRHYDAVCLMCGLTNASWKPGDGEWREWISPRGTAVLPAVGTLPDTDPEPEGKKLEH
jgi:hypothetical protein